jgi:hypothetical protein
MCVYERGLAGDAGLELAILEHREGAQRPRDLAQQAR